MSWTSRSSPAGCGIGAEAPELYCEGCCWSYCEDCVDPFEDNMPPKKL